MPMILRPIFQVIAVAFSFALLVPKVLDLRLTIREEETLLLTTLTHPVREDAFSWMKVVEL